MRASTSTRCDRNVTLGNELEQVSEPRLFYNEADLLSFPISLSKILKCAGNDDNITMSAADDGDKITLTFEAKNETEVSEYDVKLMNLDSEYLVRRC